MSKLPTNLVKRKNAFYFRMQIDGRDKWISLGSNYQRAMDAHRLLSYEFKSGREQQRIASRLGALSSPEPSEPKLFEQLAQQWLQDYVAVRRDSKGQKLALQRYRDFIAPSLGDRIVSELAPADLRKVQFELSSQGLAVNTVRHVLADIRCMLLYAERELRWINHAPVPARFLPKKPEEAPKRLTDGEVEKLLAAASGNDSLAIRLALQTGIRWGELKSLRWTCLQTSALGPHLVLEKTKSKRVRRVYLSEVLAAELETSRSKSKHDPMFPALPFSPRPITKRIRKTCGLSWHFHQLRHTFASRWLEAGGSKEALRQALGHSTIQLTELYGRVSDDYVANETRAVAKVVAEVVARPKTEIASLSRNRPESIETQQAAVVK